MEIEVDIERRKTRLEKYERAIVEHPGASAAKRKLIALGCHWQSVADLACEYADDASARESDLTWKRFLQSTQKLSRDILRVAREAEKFNSTQISQSPLLYRNAFLVKKGGRFLWELPSDENAETMDVAGFVQTSRGYCALLDGLVRAAREYISVRDTGQINLVLLCAYVRAKTGHAHFSDIAALLEAAYLMFGKETDVSERAVQKKVQRFRERELWRYRGEGLNKEQRAQLPRIPPNTQSRFETEVGTLVMDFENYRREFPGVTDSWSFLAFRNSCLCVEIASLIEGTQDHTEF